uniref:Transposase Tc1-like domain-containing protein n=1 Tax=Amphimedon queenslandica TaxID=400682 RepID=A0A1X7SNV9_AMPQE
MKDEGLKVKVSAVCRLLRKYRETGNIARKLGSGCPTKITPDVLRIVENQMQLDDEITAIQLQRILADNGHPLTLMTILRSREKLGWTFRGSAYCQLIREVNKGNRLHWAQEHVQEACSDGGFLNVLWTDECSVMLECHRRFCCRKQGTPARPKPRLATFNVHVPVHVHLHVPVHVHL